MHACKRCERVLDDDMYYESNQATCKTCLKARARRYYEDNTDQQRASMARWAINNRERSREIKQAYRERNRDTERAYGQFRRMCQPEKVAAIQTRYREANLEVYAAAQAKRRAALLQATPRWANFEDIAAFYVFAAELTRHGPDAYEVDHIVPLQGELVSGLHVAHNLRVVLRAVNRSKSNSFTQESEHG